MSVDEDCFYRMFTPGKGWAIVLWGKWKSIQLWFENVLHWDGMGLDWFDLGLDDIALKRMRLPCLRLNGFALDKVACLTRTEAVGMLTQNGYSIEFVGIPLYFDSLECNNLLLDFNYFQAEAWSTVCAFNAWQSDCRDFFLKKNARAFRIQISQVNVHGC